MRCASRVLNGDTGMGDVDIGARSAPPCTANSSLTRTLLRPRQVEGCVCIGAIGGDCAQLLDGLVQMVDSDGKWVRPGAWWSRSR